MKIDKEWEKLKERSNVNIRSETGIPKQILQKKRQSDKKPVP